MTVQPPAPDCKAEENLKHVAIIMDGNGRWAQSRGLPRSEGHRAGIAAVKRAVKAAIEQDIAFLTIYAFSSENWGRPQSEIDDLFGLLKHFIKKDLSEIHSQNVKIKVIGAKSKIPSDVEKMLNQAVCTTEQNTGLTLLVAFNYGGRDELVRAFEKLRDVHKDIPLTEEMVSGALDTHDIPDPDLIIRTSGEQRISNFLVWQSAYAELVFLNIHWPDFNENAFTEALNEYKTRQRRFGGINVSPLVNNSV